MPNEVFNPSELDLERLFDLFSIPNDIIKEHYGTRIRLSMWVAEKPNAISWSVKLDDVIEPIAILVLKAPDARFDAVKSEVDDSPKSPEPCLYELRKEFEDIVKVHGCSYAAFFDGKNLMMYRVVIAERRARKIKTQPEIAVSTTRGVTCRYNLLLLLGSAIKQANIKISSPLPGYTLDESTIDALPLEIPPPRFFDDAALTTNREVHKVPYSTDDTCLIHTVISGGLYRPIRVDPSPLPAATDQDLNTPAKVRTFCHTPVSNFLINCGKAHMDNDLKYSFNLIPDTLIWYVRHPQIRSNKDLVAILKFAAAGTIVPGDWGIVKPDLTFTNDEGIVRTARPVYEGLSRLGQEGACYCVALFDYRSLVLVTRKKGGKVKPIVALVTGDGTRRALLQWLLRSFEIAEDTVDKVW